MDTMLLAVLNIAANESPKAFNLFAVDLRHGKLTPVTSLGDRALFLGHDRSVSVSSRDLPSISGNLIYFAMPGRKLNPVTTYSLDDGSFEKPATLTQIHDMVRMIRPPVQPCTLGDHLLTYCHHREWTIGIMFHECYFVPSAWSNLRKAIARFDSEVVVPELIKRNGVETEEVAVPEPVKICRKVVYL